MGKRKRYFYDTEFLEDGKNIYLISIGMVCEDGREYYAVSPTFPHLEVFQNEWLMENVMSSIGYIETDRFGGPFIITDPAVKLRSEIRDDILEFTKGTWPEFWAWYGAYDHVALCQLFGKMIDLPDHFPMFTRDIRQHWEYKGRPELPKQAEGKHNALEDARHNKVMFDWLEGINVPQT